MKKSTMILSLVLLVGMLAFGSIAPGHAWATSDGQPELTPPDNDESGDGLIFEQNDGLNDGDPDSAGDGFGFWGQGVYGGFDGDVELGDLTFEDLLEWVLAQLIPAP